jgi:hypothetical protein
MSPSISAGGDISTLELRNLVPFTRITFDLNRIMDAQRKRAEQLGERSRQPHANQPAAQPKSQGLSEELSRTMLNALLASHSIAPAETPLPPPETTAERTKSVSDTVPPKARPSAPEGRQPQLTAPDRISPHRKASAGCRYIRSSTRSGSQLPARTFLPLDIGPSMNQSFVGHLRFVLPIRHSDRNKAALQRHDLLAIAQRQEFGL